MDLRGSSWVMTISHKKIKVRVVKSVVGPYYGLDSTLCSLDTVVTRNAQAFVAYSNQALFLFHVLYLSWIPQGSTSSLLTPKTHPDGSAVILTTLVTEPVGQRDLEVFHVQIVELEVTHISSAQDSWQKL